MFHAAQEGKGRRVDVSGKQSSTPNGAQAAAYEKLQLGLLVQTVEQVNAVLASAHDHIKITTKPQNNHLQNHLQTSQTELL